MPQMPAIYNSCGAIFSSGFVFDNCSNVTLSGNSSGPCPKCGGMGHVPDRVFDFTGSVIKLLSGPKRTVNELARILVNVQKQKLTKEQVEEIPKEVPELNSISSVLPKTSGELYQFITLIISAITLNRYIFNFII